MKNGITELVFILDRSGSKVAVALHEQRRPFFGDEC